MTAIDLYEKDDARAAVRAEFVKNTSGKTYKPYIPAGPPPIRGQ